MVFSCTEHFNRFHRFHQFKPIPSWNIQWDIVLGLGNKLWMKIWPHCGVQIECKFLRLLLIWTIQRLQRIYLFNMGQIIGPKYNVNLWVYCLELNKWRITRALWLASSFKWISCTWCMLLCKWTFFYLLWSCGWIYDWKQKTHKMCLVHFMVIFHLWFPSKVKLTWGKRKEGNSTKAYAKWPRINRKEHRSC